MTAVFLIFGNLGMSEIVFILFFVLLFFGSKSIPKVAKGLAKGMREIQNARAEIAKQMSDATRDMANDVRDMNPVNQLKQTLDQPSSPTQNTVNRREEQSQDQKGNELKMNSQTDKNSKS